MRVGIFLLAMSLGCVPALAQDSPEARLREMLRRTAADLRVSQDSQATLQATLDQEKQKSAALQKQIEQLMAAPPKPAVSDEEIQKMRADLQNARTQAATLEASLKQWQDAYQKAADLARAKDAESRAAAARAAESGREAGICAAANTKLTDVANEILHLYQTQGFRSLLITSYEPLLGLKKVELQNTIQDYEDKIFDQKYRPARDAMKMEAPK